MSTIKKNLPDFPNLVLITLIVLAILFATIGANAQFRSTDYNSDRPKIKDITITRNSLLTEQGTPNISGYVQISAILQIKIPEALAVLPNKAKLAESYSQMYSILSVDSFGYALFRADTTLSLFMDQETAPTMLTEAYIQNWLLTKWNEYAYKFSLFALFPFDPIIGKKFNGTTWEY